MTSSKVLILGMSRCGTQSIADALIELGHGPIYHMREVRANDHQDKWTTLINKKAAGEKVTRDELDALLGPWNGLADFPASIFAEELIESYPDAVVILNTRNEDDWVRSMNATVWGSYSKPDHDKTHPQYPLRKAYHDCCWGGDFPANGRQYYRDYCSKVREVGGERVIEYNIKMGWEPLCRAVGEPVPDRPFPRHDDVAPYKIQPKDEE